MFCFFEGFFESKKKIFFFCMNYGDDVIDDLKYDVIDLCVDAVIEHLGKPKRHFAVVYKILTVFVA